MAEQHKSGDAPHGTLAEGAERLERLVLGLKDNQLARTRTKAGLQPPVSQAFVFSPDEAWAKKYMTHCIGPVCFPAAGTDIPAFAKFSAKPAPQAANQGFQVAPANYHPAPHKQTLQADFGTLGGAIGKPVRRRSWLGRLLRGR